MLSNFEKLLIDYRNVLYFLPSCEVCPMQYACIRGAPSLCKEDLKTFKKVILKEYYKNHY